VERVRARRRLRRAELPEDAVALARFLIGVPIVSDAPDGRTIARIVETEAYVPGDAAAHSFRGETARNRSLFLERGHAYVYFIYGAHYCFNVSAERAGIGAGVLVRAAEPLEGIRVMRERRPGSSDRDLLRGPGRLAQGLAIGRSSDGLDLCAEGPLWLARPSRKTEEEPDIGVSRRIGLTKEIDRPLRFFDLASTMRSGPKSFS
jgi:DNA-3-methyladenine glycosylase